MNVESGTWLNYTHSAKSHKAYGDFKNHGDIDDDLENVKWEAWTTVGQAKHNRRYRERRHPKVEEYVCP